MKFLKKVKDFLNSDSTKEKIEKAKEVAKKAKTGFDSACDKADLKLKEALAKKNEEKDSTDKVVEEAKTEETKDEVVEEAKTEETKDEVVEEAKAEETKDEVVEEAKAEETKDKEVKEVKEKKTKAKAKVKED